MPIAAASVAATKLIGTKGWPGIGSAAPSRARSRSSASTVAAAESPSRKPIVLSSWASSLIQTTAIASAACRKMAARGTGSLFARRRGSNPSCAMRSTTRGPASTMLDTEVKSASAITHDSTRRSAGPPSASAATAPTSARPAKAAIGAA
jgi:hypothetical protein